MLSTAVGRPVEVQAYADRIVIRQDGVIVAEHGRCFSRNETVYDPWHYVPVLARKPGALRKGAPFQGRTLPSAMEWRRSDHLDVERKPHARLVEFGAELSIDQVYRREILDTRAKFPLATAVV